MQGGSKVRGSDVPQYNREVSVSDAGRPASSTQKVYLDQRSHQLVVNALNAKKKPQSPNGGLAQAAPTFKRIKTVRAAANYRKSA